MQKKMTPFSFVDDINFKKQDLYNSDTEEYYVPFLINRALSFNIDTILQANDMNIWHDLDKDMQYEYLKRSIRARKRFGTWYKPVKDEKIALIMEHYKYSRSKAVQVADLIDDEELIKIRNKKGGTIDEQHR